MFYNSSSSPKPIQLTDYTVLTEKAPTVSHASSAVKIGSTAKITSIFTASFTPGPTAATAASSSSLPRCPLSRKRNATERDDHLLRLSSLRSGVQSTTQVRCEQRFYRYPACNPRLNLEEVPKGNRAECRRREKISRKPSAPICLDTFTHTFYVHNHLAGVGCGNKQWDKSERKAQSQSVILLQNYILFRTSGSAIKEGSRCLWLLLFLHFWDGG